MELQSVNPATGEVIARYREMDRTEVEDIIGQAHKAFNDWRAASFAQRAVVMNAVAGTLKHRAHEFATLMAKEMGKPVSAGRAEVEKCAWVCEYYAQSAERFLTSEHVQTEAAESFVSFQPLGTVLAVMPWNFPFWQVFRFAAPALMAGNVALLKHASNVTGCALALEDILLTSGLPKNVFRTLVVSGSNVAHAIQHPLVRAVTLTGSTPAGRSVAATAGAALKKVVLELGGSDPYIILADADIEAAAKTCATSRLINSGQSCIAAKRFVVVGEVMERFEELLTGHMAAAIVGDPLNEKTTVGPLARADLREELHQQVVESVRHGAVIRIGGSIPGGSGAFYPPTVLTNVRRGMPAYHEELFGPVAAVIGVADERQAVEVANDSPFGLGAAVFTRDREKGRRIAAAQLEAGTCCVNDLVKSDPRLPFGGVKESGFGRELSYFGIREFVNIKSVVVK